MSMETKKTLCGSQGRRFQLFRMLAGYSQEEASRKLFVSREVLACYETDRAEPNIETLMRMRKLYRQPLDSLLGAPAIDFPESDLLDIEYAGLVNMIKRPNFDYELARKRINERNKFMRKDVKSNGKLKEWKDVFIQ